VLGICQDNSERLRTDPPSWGNCFTRSNSAVTRTDPGGEQELSDRGVLVTGSR